MEYAASAGSTAFEPRAAAFDQRIKNLAKTQRYVVSGPIPQAPQAFGQYESGRSGMPWSKIRKRQSAAFLDTTAKGLATEKTGEPGQYDPYKHSALVNEQFSKKPKPFDSTAFRDMSLETGKTDSPGPVYDVIWAKYRNKLDPKVESRSVASFRSRSLQRPSSKSDVPGSGTYSPNLDSILANRPNSGASLRSRAQRMHVERPMTASSIGPGTYAQYDGSLYFESERAVSRSSRLQPGFGSTSAQFAIPLRARPRQSPGPGAYEPIQPRIRDVVRLNMRAALRSPGAKSYAGPPDTPKKATPIIRV